MAYQPDIDSFFHTRSLTPKFIEGAPSSWRVRARLAVRGTPGKAEIGLFKPGSHEVLDRDTYPDHHPALDGALSALREQINQLEICPYSETTLQGDLRYIQLTASPASNKVEIALVANGKQPLPRLKKLAPDHSLWINIQEGSTNTIFGTNWHHIHGDKWLYQQLLQREIAFHPGAFIQSNLALFEKIIQAIKERSLPDKKVLELYAGVGAIGLNLDAPHVTMVEINPLAHASYHQTIQQIAEKERYTHLIAPAALLDTPELLIVDPPRKGCDQELLKEIAASSTLEQLLYVSCNFATLRRDVEFLEKSGWKIQWAETYDLFPGTGHFEYLLDLRRSG